MAVGRQSITAVFERDAGSSLRLSTSCCCHQVLFAYEARSGDVSSLKKASTLSGAAVVGAIRTGGRSGRGASRCGGVPSLNVALSVCSALFFVNQSMFVIFRAGGGCV